MRVFILAAGRGTRISREINGRPKCTVSLSDSESLIEYTVDTLRARGIDDIHLVLGYQQSVIRSVLKGRPARYHHNPFFDVTNSIASLWFARDAFEPFDDCLIMNGDVYLSPEAMDAILNEKASPVMFYDTTRIVEADYRFFCQDGRLVRYGKELSNEETSGEYVGCARLSGREIPGFLDTLGSLIAEQKHSLWWENVLYHRSEKHVIYVKDLAGTFWGEVDFVEDYERIMAFHHSARGLLPNSSR